MGKGSAIGPALDGIASRKDKAYLVDSLLDPNEKLAESHTAYSDQFDVADRIDPKALGNYCH